MDVKPEPPKPKSCDNVSDYSKVAIQGGHKGRFAALKITFENLPIIKIKAVGKKVPPWLGDKKKFSEQKF